MEGGLKKLIFTVISFVDESLSVALDIFKKSPKETSIKRKHLI
jgi:hypothetical protein